MKRQSFYLLVLTLFVIVNPIAQAQVSVLKQGDKLRIITIDIPPDTLLGRFDTLNTTQLTLLHKKELVILPWTTIRRMEKAITQKYPGRGAAIGAGIGGGLTGLIVLGSSNSCGPDESFCIELFTPGEAFLGGLIIGGLTGGFLGLIIGNSIQKQSWKEININLNDQSEEQKLTVGLDQWNPGITMRWSF
jgi:hypothetical protein